MKISGTNPVRPNNTVRKKDAASSSTTAPADDFLSILGTGSSAPAASASNEQPISDIQPVSNVGALLTLQEMPEDELNKRKAIIHSKSTLETLEQLRHSLLTGGVPTHVLHELNRLVNAQRHIGIDPKLKDILDDIELRAAVELAKLEVASGS